MAAIEFALVLPLLLMILLGIIEFGFVLFINTSVVNAAREGVRTGAVLEDHGAAQQEAIQTAQTHLQRLGNLTQGATTDASVTQGFSGDILQLSIELPYTPLTGFLPAGMLPEQVRYVAAMRLER